MSMIAMVSAAVGTALLVAAPAASVAAHTESDLVGVPAGTRSTVTLKPTHGCGDSPTVAVRIRAPSPDATAGEVEGWSATSTPDGAGNTVVEWTGGVVPADEDGAFPVEFTAPDAPGVLLTFPAIQVCENGEELAWISGDPTDEFPAPRVLVLPVGSEPAETIDDVPLDAPGRDQLVAIVDVDNPAASSTTVAPTTVAPTTGAPTTTAPAATTSVPVTTAAAATTTIASPPTSAGPPSTQPTGSSAPPTEAVATDDDSGRSTGPIIVVGALAAAALGGGALAIGRRRANGGSVGLGASDDDHQIAPGPGDP